MGNEKKENKKTIADLVRDLSSFDDDCEIIITDPASLIVILKNGKAVEIMSHNA